MIRRRKPASGREDLYRIVWQGDPFMLNRIDMIIETGTDPFAGSSQSAILEKALDRLVNGGQRKYAGLEELNTGVRSAIDQLFTMRDAGRFGGDHGVGNHPAHRG